MNDNNLIEGFLGKIKGYLNFFDPLADGQPLVSVIIPTYNRAKLLTERAIPSIFRQTYQNFEIIVVGDHCQDDTEERLKAINDNRVRFYNMDERSKYPSDPIDRWHVLAVPPLNFGLDMASGQWITHLDDDDVFYENHIQVLLSACIRHSYDFVYGIVQREFSHGKWERVGAYPLTRGKICHNSVLYNAEFKSIKYDINAWKIKEPADWNRWRRIAATGAKIGFVKKEVGKYFLGKMSLAKDLGLDHLEDFTPLVEKLCKEWFKS